ncbi:hypothetical protein NIES4101_46120 [Calothrix sp. NIES-4101]|nr:hypothetical protein NIES4101_46120 [Calothrix sp. NIES-4101]
MKTKFEKGEFAAMLASVGQLVEILTRSENYQELLNHPDYQAGDVTLTDSLQGIEETATFAAEIFEAHLIETAYTHANTK